MHATPRSDEERLLPDTPDPQATAMLAGVDAPTLLYGHVHLQHRRALDGLEVVNPGSVGFPFDGDPRAAWAVIEDGAVELRRTAYDVERALARLAAAASPRTGRGRQGRRRSALRRALVRRSSSAPISCPRRAQVRGGRAQSRL